MDKMSEYTFTTNFNLDIKGVEELFNQPKRYNMRIALNDTIDDIQELCKNKDAELVLGDSRFKILDFPTLFIEENERGIYVDVEQIN